MNQSSVIFGFLALAFLVFITQRGELPTYWGFLVKSPAAPSSGPTATAVGQLTGVASSLASIDTLATALQSVAV